uniref:Uncharacterized protein n=1 Tax=Sphaerodactylus townsendi TaxID=933632 RepID=A0ACB8FL37_9SAUR
MEEWISSLKSVQSREHYETAQFNVEHFSGMHNWYACSHARPTFCNVCRESLSGVTSHGLSCEGINQYFSYITIVINATIEDNNGGFQPAY